MVSLSDAGQLPVIGLLSQALPAHPARYHTICSLADQASWLQLHIQAIVHMKCH